MVACRSTEVVSTSMSRGDWPGQRTNRGSSRVAEDGSVRLPEQVVLPEVVPVIGADDDAGGLGQPCLVDRLDEEAEPVVDHGQLGPVVVPEVARPGGIEMAAADGVDQVGGQMAKAPSRRSRTSGIGQGLSNGSWGRTRRPSGRSGHGNPPTSGSNRRRRTWSGGRGSPPRPGSRCGSRRRRGDTGVARPEGPEHPPRSDRGWSSTGDSRGLADRPRR